MKKIIKDQIDFEKVNEMTARSNQILKLVYAFLVLAGIYLLTMIANSWHVGEFLLGLLQILSPVIFGIFLAWLLNPLVAYLETKKIRKGISITAIYIIIVAIVYLFLITFVPIMISQVKILVDSLPAIGNSLNKWSVDILSSLNQVIDVDAIRTTIDKEVLQLATSLGKSIPGFVVSSLSGVFFTILTITVGMMVGFYLLIDYNGFICHAVKILPKKYRNEVSNLLNDVNKQSHNYVRGLLLVLITLFIICAIVFNIIGLKAAILLAFICMVTDIIPYIGPYIGGMIVVLMGLSQSPKVAIFALIAVIIIQSIEANVLQPVIMGKTMKLHPVTIIVSLLVCGYLFGIIGMILATPIVAAVKTIFNFYNQKLKLIDTEEEA